MSVRTREHPALQIQNMKFLNFLMRMVPDPLTWLNLDPIPNHWVILLAVFNQEVCFTVESAKGEHNGLPEHRNVKKLFLDYILLGSSTILNKNNDILLVIYEHIEPRNCRKKGNGWTVGFFCSNNKNRKFELPNSSLASLKSQKKKIYNLAIF